jgi:hypothetical protein
MQKNQASETTMTDGRNDAAPDLNGLGLLVVDDDLMNPSLRSHPSPALAAPAPCYRESPNPSERSPVR